MTDSYPRRIDTENRRCPDCREETVHLVLEWSARTTYECRGCGAIYEGEIL